MRSPSPPPPAAHWFYRDKTSFETKYGEDCGDDPCNEPAWVTDGGRGKPRSGLGEDFGVATATRNIKVVG